MILKYPILNTPKCTYSLLYVTQVPLEPRSFVLEIGTEELPPSDVAHASQEVCKLFWYKFVFPDWLILSLLYDFLHIRTLSSSVVGWLCAIIIATICYVTQIIVFNINGVSIYPVLIWWFWLNTNFCWLQLQNLLVQLLEKQRLSHGKVFVFGTPRRLVVCSFHLVLLLFRSRQTKFSIAYIIIMSNVLMIYW